MELASEPFVWLAIAFLVVGVVLRSAWFRGYSGEFKVRTTSGLRLDGEKYHSLHNLTLPTPDGTTQIDHVIVSKFGVFVIETKNRKGWIFGDEGSRKWTQSIYGKNYPFQNPLRQNYRHVKAVEALLGLHSGCLHSVVVFTGNSRFRTPMPPNVLRRGSLVRYIRSKTNVCLSDSEVRAAVRALERVGITESVDKRRHLQTLRENQRNPKCPRCGRAMVVRTAKRGANVGGQFWGCTGYPKCKHTENIEKK